MLWARPELDFFIPGCTWCDRNGAHFFGSWGICETFFPESLDLCAGGNHGMHSLAHTWCIIRERCCAPWSLGVIIPIVHVLCIKFFRGVENMKRFIGGIRKERKKNGSRMSEERKRGNR